MEPQPLTIDGLAQEIRRVDGSHMLGAGALAEALIPYLDRCIPPPDFYAGGCPMSKFEAITTAYSNGHGYGYDMGRERGRRQGYAISSAVGIVASAAVLVYQYWPVIVGWFPG